MTNKEKKEWLSVKYPLTIISDRYDGTYSGAKWLAFPLDYDKIPSDVDASDPECAQFWKNYKEPVGKGAYASDAVVDLIQQMREFEPEESEDERMLDSIIESLRFYALHTRGINDKVDKQVAWLEKQKELDKMIVVSPEVWDNAISDAFENGYNDGKDEAKQKPAEYLSKRKVYDIMSKLSNLSQSELIPLDSKEFEVINEITTDVHSLLDYPIEQKSAEWSEEDKAFLKVAIAICNRYSHKDIADWLKSLPERFNLQPKQEWNEKDERNIQNLESILYYDEKLPEETRVELGNFLKSLRSQPKQEWNEKDKKMFAAMSDLLWEGYKSLGQECLPYSWKNFKAWCLSLRPQPKVEWSEEDEHRRIDAIYFLESAKRHYADTREIEKTIDWLKSLRPQYHGDVTMTEAYKMGLEAGKASSWKPSEEQMEAFKGYIEDFQARAEAAVGGWNNFDVMIRLYEQLKKL